MALTAKQIRYLFAVGAFKRSSGGGGKKGGVVYTRDAAERRANTRDRRIKKGREIAEREGMAYTRRNLPKLAGDKTTHSGKTLARVKSGGIERTKDPQKRFDKVRDVTTTTAIFQRKWTDRASDKPRARKVPSKAERDKTRAARVEEGRWRAEDKLRGMIPRRQRERFNAASVMHAQSSPSAQRQGWSEIKGIAKGLSQKRKSAAEASRTRARRLTAVANGRRTRAEKKRAAYNPLF